MLEEIVPLEPVHFFAFQMDCHYVEKRVGGEHVLSDLTPFQDQNSFAQVFLGWHERGVYVCIEVTGTFGHPNFPRLIEGDSVELFIDTRDVKTTGFTTRFCHHFFFLPYPVSTSGTESVQAGEITHFRTENGHPLCDPTLLELRSVKGKKRHTLDIFIPAECLYGYDPKEFDRLGFAYRINRIDGSKQHFSANSHNFSIESQPYLWASFKLLNSPYAKKAQRGEEMNGKIQRLRRNPTPCELDEEESAVDCRSFLLPVEPFLRKVSFEHSSQEVPKRGLR
jgi:hypothetical protein